jgi:transglutaminase superfamily protein
MIAFLLESYTLLIRAEWRMRHGALSSLHGLVKHQAIRDRAKLGPRAPRDLMQAIDLACVLYPKQVLCLQRSAATVLLLRRYGLKAELIIGAQTLPFKSHAWVEIDGAVVNDKPYMREIYRPIERW